MFSGMEYCPLGLHRTTTALHEIGAESLLIFENKKGNNFEMLCG
jgi:hypothetical protein